MEYTLTFRYENNKTRADPTRYDSMVEARKNAIRLWTKGHKVIDAETLNVRIVEFKYVFVMRAAKYISLSPVGHIEYTDRGFVWKEKGKKAKELNWDGTLVR